MESPIPSETFDIFILVKFHPKKIAQDHQQDYVKWTIGRINMDFAKIVAEQYQKQMAKQNAKMEELKKQLKMNSSDVRRHRHQLPRELQFEIYEFLPIDKQRRFIKLFKCSQAKLDKKKKNRVSLLEAMFHTQQYLARPQVIKTASILHMSKTQVKTWFQNRRQKSKNDRIFNRHPTPRPRPVCEQYILKAFFEAFNQV